ncbi:S41 family peptidase [Winogradskyella flava]|uniref:S41 family peptidase n=1 Tax=Winogradskyella flava TaxID=1884876 RepID=UPI002491BF61|nr:S41 family peptidase [Winogradskyella flava]
MKNIIVLLVFSIIVSCEKVILGEEESNTPINNFELLWQDFDAHCSLFVSKNIDWDASYNEFRLQVTNNISNEELWQIFSKMLERFDDSHVNLYTENDAQIFTSGFTLNEQSKSEYSKSLISSKYLDFRVEVTSEDNLSYGKIKEKNIGYIYLGAEDGEDPEIIETILQELSTYDSIIFDIRQNIGGDESYTRRIASAFADNENLVYTTQTRNGPSHDDFDEKTLFYSKIIGTQYPNPVILLTDRRTISAGESLALYMKTYNKVTQIGDTTAGDFSTVSTRRFLPNGWSYKYPIQLPRTPTGEFLDGNGNIPDIYIKNTEDDISNNIDKVLERAILFLFEQYNID